MLLGQTTGFVHAQLALVLHQGETAVDATVGNGHDTLFLARAVGPDGHVHGFDVQPQALATASKRLAQNGVDARTTLHERGHEHMLETLSALPGEISGKVGAITFNLGYLPGSDTAVITRPDTTCAAIDQAITLLRPSGMLSLVLYSGHPGGQEEAGRVLAHCRNLPTSKVQVMHCTMHNHAAPKVSILLLEKK